MTIKYFLEKNKKTNLTLLIKQLKKMYLIDNENNVYDMYNIYYLLNKSSLEMEYLSTNNSDKKIVYDNLESTSQEKYNFVLISKWKFHLEHL